MTSTEYYRKNREARRKKVAYQKEYNKKPSEVKKRTELNKENRERGTYGNGDGLDVSHMKNGKTKLEPASRNRARREKSRLKGSKRS